MTPVPRARRELKNDFAEGGRLNDTTTAYSGAHITLERKNGRN
jgi:hypothetical protein